MVSKRAGAEVAEGFKRKRHRPCAHVQLYAFLADLTNRGAMSYSGHRIQAAEGIVMTLDAYQQQAAETAAKGFIMPENQTTKDRVDRFFHGLPPSCEVYNIRTLAEHLGYSRRHTMDMVTGRRKSSPSFLEWLDENHQRGRYAIGGGS